MNKERLLQLADVIENQSDNIGFDMDYYLYINKCGTVACIAGHALVMETGSTEFSGETVFDQAKAYLDLTMNEAIKLFTPDWIDWPEMSEIAENRQLAANTIRDFVQTGVVEWAVEPPEGY